jgi:hypothetical protein
MHMNTFMNMTQISTAMNTIIPTAMNMGMPIPTMMPRAVMSIKTTMARTTMTIRTMALKRISTSTDGVRRKPDGSVRAWKRYSAPPACEIVHSVKWEIRFA